MRSKHIMFVSHLMCDDTSHCQVVTVMHVTHVAWVVTVMHVTHVAWVVTVMHVTHVAWVVTSPLSPASSRSASWTTYRQGIYTGAVV
jgi:hypothetical protein